MKPFPVRLVLKFQGQEELLLMLTPRQIKSLVSRVPDVFKNEGDIVPFVGFIRRVPGDVIADMRKRRVF